MIKIAKLIVIDFDKLSFLDPDVTVNIVKNSKIVEKRNLALPEKLVNVTRCKNPRCITSTERDLDQIFNLTNKEKQLYRCAYCEMSLEK